VQFSDIWLPSAGLSLRTDASWYPLLSELLREWDTGTCVALLLLPPECPFTTVPELGSACTFDSICCSLLTVPLLEQGGFGAGRLFLAGLAGGTGAIIGGRLGA